MYLFFICVKFFVCNEAFCLLFCYFLEFSGFGTKIFNRSLLPSYFIKFDFQGQFLTQNYTSCPILSLELRFDQIFIEKLMFLYRVQNSCSLTVYHLFVSSRCDRVPLQTLFLPPQEQWIPQAWNAE